MIIRSTDREIEKELKALEKAIVGNGGWIHPNFAIGYSNETGLSVYMEGSCSPDDFIITVPEDLLIPADSINLSVKGGEFSVDPDTGNLSPAQLGITRHMVSIFNLTDKVEFHKNECPWIRFREAPELMDQLLDARTLVDYSQSKQSFMHGRNGNTTFEDFVTDTFISSRVLVQDYKRDGDEQSRRVFMPFVDYMNHDYRGSMFLPVGNDKSKRGVHIQNRQLFVSSRECYVFYGTYDGLDTYLDYGFYDREPPFVRSVPLEIQVENVGKIVVYSYPNFKNKTELPKDVSDLKKFMPSINRMEDDKIELSHLFITVSQFPNALRRVLLMIIRSFSGEGITQKHVIEQVKNAEEMIVGRNIEFYRSLLNKLDENTADPPELVSEIRQIAEFQLSKLYKYYFDNAFYLKVE